MKQEKSQTTDYLEGRKIFKEINALKQLTLLNTFGFNSRKFDLAVLLPFLSKYSEIYDEKIEILKKGSQYFNISLEKIIFKDILSFSAPCSLEKYLSQWYNGDFGKSIFPYQAFESIEQIRSCQEFPSYESFHSDLKGKNVPLEDYKVAKQEYNRRRYLDPTDPDFIADFSGRFYYFHYFTVYYFTTLLLTILQIYYFTIRLAQALSNAGCCTTYRSYRNQFQMFLQVFQPESHSQSKSSFFGIQSSFLSIRFETSLRGYF